MNLKPNKHKRISFNTTTMTSLGFIGPPLKFSSPPPNSVFCSSPPPLKLGGGAVTMIVLKDRVCLSFRSSFHLYVSFLGIGSLFFSETQHAVRDPSTVICDSWIFWKTSLSGENDQKWSKMTPKQGFWTF